jgi:hypothetical protein
MHDVIVIGGGPGGYAAAIRAGQLGADVALAERAELGGIWVHLRQHHPHALDGRRRGGHVRAPRGAHGSGGRRLCLVDPRAEAQSARSGVAGPGPFRVLRPADAIETAEAAIAMGWERYTGAGGAFVGITGFGASAPGGVVLEKFGFTPETVVRAALNLLGKPEVEEV